MILLLLITSKPGFHKLFFKRLTSKNLKKTMAPYNKTFQKSTIKNTYDLFYFYFAFHQPLKNIWCKFQNYHYKQLRLFFSFHLQLQNIQCKFQIITSRLPCGSFTAHGPPFGPFAALTLLISFIAPKEATWPTLENPYLNITLGPGSPLFLVYTPYIFFCKQS